MIENERHRQIMEYLHSQDKPVTCKQIYQACNLMADVDDTAKVLLYLRKTRKWLEMIGQRPRTYVITDEGARAVKGEEPKKDRQKNNEPPPNDDPSPALEKPSLADTLDEMISKQPPPQIPIEYSVGELILMQGALQDLLDVLQTHLPGYQELKDITDAIKLIDAIRTYKETVNS